MSNRAVTLTVWASAIAATLLMTAASDVLAADNTVVLMPGTKISVALRQTVATATARAGDHIEGELARDITTNGRTAVPRGSKVDAPVAPPTPSATPTHP